MKTLDTRDLEERLNELHDEFQTWLEQLTDDEKKEIADNWEEPLDRMEEHHFKDEWMIATSDGEEYKGIQDLKDQFGREWFDGVELIREQDFEEYAQDFAERIGAINHNADWPACHIDWEAAANSLMADYSSVDYDGETYYFRG
jgi:antirestriction protein